MKQSTTIDMHTAVISMITAAGNHVQMEFSSAKDNITIKSPDFEQYIEIPSYFFADMVYKHMKEAVNNLKGR